MNASEPIIIVGAGLAGAATAYHLRKLGVEHVRILERGRGPGRGASGRSASILRERMELAELAPWSRASAAALRDLGVVRRTGGFELDDGTDEARSHVAGAQGTGTYLPDDGVVDVPTLLAHYLEGQPVEVQTAVHSFEACDGGLSLRTSGGDRACRTLVNATGSFAGVFGHLDLQPTKRHLFVGRSEAPSDPKAPYVWDLRADYYFRPEDGGWMFCACDETPCAPSDDAVDPQALRHLRAKLRVHQPHLADARMARQWCGHRTFAPDRLPVVGWDPRTKGLFHVAGLGGHGVTLSHEVGRIAAASILGIEEPPGAFEPGRVLLLTQH